MILTDNCLNTTLVEYGDYQTPVPFVRRVCKKLSSFYKLHPMNIIEPTFGIGNFLEGIIDVFNDTCTIYGIEINKEYCNIAEQRINSNLSLKSRVKLYNSNVFAFDFNDIKDSLSPKDQLLIIGNPPWITNSQLASIGSDNLPKKSNFKGHSGFDAMTGKGNFDVSEYIILKLLSEFANFDCILAMLCKTVVAKNIVRDIGKYDFSISSIDLFTFNATEIFNVSCDAGLLVVRLGKPNIQTCSVYNFNTNEKIKEFGWVDNAFYSNTQTINGRSEIDGSCQLTWRQGIKHDCSKVMELVIDENGFFKNGLGDTHCFQIASYVYPLLKSSDIRTHEITGTRKYVIVTQKRVGEDTSKIKRQDIIIWEYLQKHESYLAARRSSIYKNAPKYAIFGVGDYSFSNYKVGISGFYKEPIFAVIVGNTPILMDDTCYFLSFSKVEDAYITLALLNSSVCITFLKTIAFLDSKRPYTKDILQRIDLHKLYKLMNYDYVRDFVSNLPSRFILTKLDYDNYLRNEKVV